MKNQGGADRPAGTARPPNQEEAIFRMPSIQYFLGGNTPSGFYSLYHQLSDPERFRALYIIKSGPGSGAGDGGGAVLRRSGFAGRGDDSGVGGGGGGWDRAPRGGVKRTLWGTSCLI